MRWLISSILLLSLLAQSHQSVARSFARRSYDTHDYYVLEHDPLVRDASLPEVLNELGVELVEQAGELKNHWLVRTDKSDPSSNSDHDPVQKRYANLLQEASSFQGRSEASLYQRHTSLARSIKFLEKQTPRQRTKRAPPTVTLADTPINRIIKQFDIKDPLFRQQWHLVNKDHPTNTMNVTGVWDMGYTGKNVITSFIDDGLDYTSLDLKDNFVAEFSHDFNDHEDLPTPKLSDDHHGTRCAGQVAAGKNDYCGVGIAYDSHVSGVRILSGPISDVDEAASLNLGFQNVSIYSCSWGPPDNGQTMEGPTILIKKAMVNGIENGRGGKGSIFVFASGNGAASGDQCNFDGYTNSIYSITVSAIDYKNMHPYYSEPCAANLVVAYSSGGGKSIVTTDRGVNQCSQGHGGTSAAAPNAAGVIALALEARPDLGWRDVQHLAIRTSRQINPDDTDWEKTASGRPYSYKYGYGAIDAYELVKAALDWKLVKPQSWYHSPTIRLKDGGMDFLGQYSGGEYIPLGGLSSTFTMTKEIWEANNLERLEHINVKVWIDHVRRGDVEVALISPSGVISVLAGRRSHDAATTGYPGWTFMTVKHWDENPIGDWTLRVWDQADPLFTGKFLGWNMIFWGECIDPSKTTTYEVPLTDYLLPPPPEASAVSAPPGTTTLHSKPTGYLPEDHDVAEGENSNPAFGTSTPAPTPTKAEGSTSDTTESAASSSTPAHGKGWFKGINNLSNSQKWVFGALVVVVIFGAGAGVWLLRRRAARRRQQYSSLPEDEVGMTSIRGSRASGGRRTKELYDAFGEVSDEEADEETRLRPAASASNVGLEYHEGFLDDDEPSTAGRDRYRDDPEEQPPRQRDRSPSDSGDGSWEHTS